MTTSVGKYWRESRKEDPPSRELLRACASVAGAGGDLGAGMLRATRLLLENPDVTKVYAIDAARERLQAGLQQLTRCDRVLGIQGDLQRLPFATGSLDFVVLAAAFHHARDPGLLLGEIARVLKRTGTCWILEETPVRWYLRWIWMKRWIEGVGGNPFRRQVLIDRELGDYGYSRSAYRRLLNRAGFSIEVETETAFLVKK
jgi:ubiquinone/menaquinone biosynthesis C-methylase UbiE